MSDSRTVEMRDGRSVNFGEKQRMNKDYGVDGAGMVFCQIDFDNGETIRVEVNPSTPIGQSACGHGLSQKLGDTAAGADTTNDAFEAVLEVATRISNNEWNKGRAEGGGSAKGASELVEALVVVLGKDKDTVRNMLVQLKQADKMALRKTPAIAAEIEKIKAARAPSKAEKDKAAVGADLLAALKTAALV